MNKVLASLLLLSVAVLIYTLVTMPDPYRYGGCPDEYKLQSVVTTCEPVK